MKIKHLISEAKKGVVAPKYNVKPRNFVAKNAIQSGAGAHKDKKKADKQGDVKHKNKELAEGAVKELMMDIKSLPENEFIAKYKMTKAEARAEMKSTNSLKDNLSEQYVGNGSSKDMQMAVDMAKMNAKRAALEKIHGSNYTNVQMPDHEFGKVDLQSDGKGGYRASVPITIKQAPQSNYLDSKPAVDTPSKEPTSYMDNMPAKSDGKQTGTMAPMESTRNPDLMSPNDYDRYQQRQMDADRSNFKNREMEQELGHEVNNIAVLINGKLWKIFPGNGPDNSQAFFKQKQSVADMCERKSQTPNKFGKLNKWTWGVTGEAPTA